MYDTRRFDRVAQVQHSLNEIELLAADGSVETTHRSQVSGRYVYKQEMQLLLRVAGFARWEIYGDFDRRPLTNENDAMIVAAWSDRPRRSNCPQAESPAGGAPRRACPS